MNDKTQTIDQTLEQTLERTDLGHVINENKKGILVAGVIIVIAVIAFAFYSHQKEQSYIDNLSQVYAFEQDVIQKYNDKKLSDDEFIAKIKAMPSHLTGQATLVPSLFVALDKLIENGKSLEVSQVLESWAIHFNTTSYMYYFIGLKLAPLYENQTEYDKAINIYQNLIASKIDLTKARLYLDLGRIYLKKGDASKARENFEFINKKFEGSEASKLADLYLQKL